MLACAALNACAPSRGQEAPAGAEAGGGVFSGAIRFYQGPLGHLDAVRRGPCPMFPSCSEYARQAVAAHGPLVGWVMAHDRLLRCGRDEAALAPRILVEGRRRIYDPVEANDFWWRAKTPGTD